PDIHHRGAVRQADAMLQIAAIFEDLLVDIVRFIPVQMNDLQAIGQDASGPVAEALVRPFPGERHYPARIPRGPRLQPQEDDFDCVAARAERAARVQQLLKDLIVGRKFDVDRRAEMVTPEAQGILYRLSGEIRGDDEVGGRRFTGRVGGSSTLNVTPERSKYGVPDWSNTRTLPTRLLPSRSLSGSSTACPQSISGKRTSVTAIFSIDRRMNVFPCSSMQHASNCVAESSRLGCR